MIVFYSFINFFSGISCTFLENFRTLASLVILAVILDLSMNVLLKSLRVDKLLMNDTYKNDWDACLNSTFLHFSSVKERIDCQVYSNTNIIRTYFNTIVTKLTTSNEGITLYYSQEGTSSITF